MKAIAALSLAYLLIAATAFADPAPPTANATDPGYISPVSVGPPHSCKNYPDAAKQQGRSGSTVLIFDITTEGDVANLQIATSSGQADLDRAAVTCVMGWRYTPAKRDGVPIQVLRFTTVSFYIDDNRRSAPALAGPVPNCLSTHPDAASQLSPGMVGVTVIGYELSNGEVLRAEHVQSSGDNTLDEFAYSCVKQWRFKPDMDTGGRATGTFNAIFDWNLVKRNPSSAPSNSSP